MARVSNIPDNQWFVGQDTDIPFSVTDAAGAPQNMTGWALEFILRALDDGEQVLKKTTALGQVVIGNGAGTNDRATVAITRADTLNVVPGVYAYALWRTSTNSNTVLAVGTAVLAAVPAQ